MEHNSTRELEESIEHLVQAHIQKIRTAAQAAVERAFAANDAPRARPPRRSVSGRSSPSTGAGTSRPRRSRAELAALEERLYQVIAEKPGETMTVIAPVLETSARDLIRPMAALKRSGRVRSVGERHLTRYFPLAAEGGEAMSVVS